MSRLFEKTIINGMELPNRFVRSATWEGLATPEGEATPALIDRMTALASGGVGLIISSHAYVSSEGQATPWQLGIDDDKQIPGLRQMAAAVHDHSGRMLLQLAHAGVYAATDLTGQPGLSVSPPAEDDKKKTRVITAEEIDRLVLSFARAAQRAQQAGFDGVQLHSGHGYLLSQFLSPAHNRRNDEYGGPVENRARIHLRIIAAVRAAVGADYPLLIKMNGEDFIDNGLTGAEALQAAQLFAEAGLDAIEVSGGTITSGKLSPSRPAINTPDKEAYFREYAKKFKRKINIPLILVGGIRSLDVAEEIVAAGTADYISMSRPFIREPDLISRWQSGDRRPAACLSDNLCFQPGFAGQGIYCVTREKEEKKGFE